MVQAYPQTQKAAYQAQESSSAPQKDHIHQYTFNFPVNSIAFNHHADQNVTLAVGSLNMEKANNSVSILRFVDSTTISNEQPQQPQSTKHLVKVTEFNHDYPPSKLQWAPESTLRPDFLASDAEHVRIW